MSKSHTDNHLTWTLGTDSDRNYSIRMKQQTGNDWLENQDYLKKVCVIDQVEVFELSWELQPHPSTDMRGEWCGGETHRDTRSAGKWSPKQ